MKQCSMEQYTGSKLGREYDNAAYWHYLCNLIAEYLVWNSRLDESQVGIKIAGRNINNLRYADDNTLMSESKKELKIRAKEESEKAA